MNTRIRLSPCWLFLCFFLFTNFAFKKDYLFIFYNQYACLHCYSTLTEAFMEAGIDKEYNIVIATLKPGDKPARAFERRYALNLCGNNFEHAFVSEKQISRSARHKDSTFSTVFHHRTPTPCVALKPSFTSSKSEFIPLPELFDDIDIRPETIERLLAR
ncbi:MAG: hypothetical protein M3Q97_06080 [Bacteroidota bacterium]|nr:hypothetical protein [Bacteroidota bacterium]